MKKKSNRVTITQVAEKSKVTIGTVSHVINGTAPISPEVTARVQKVIEELNYIPNMTARSLRSKKSKQVGFLVPNLNNSFYPRILSTFINHAFEHEFIVQIFGYEYSVEKELQVMNNLSSNSVDIVIIINGMGDEAGINRLLDMHKKVILADRFSDMKGVNCIFFDNNQAILEAVALMKSKGYRKIGFISEPLTFTNIQERFAGFQAALSACGYAFAEDDVFICGGFQLDALVNGYHYMSNILEKRDKKHLPDAFIATSDLLAIGTIRALREHGYQVPGDFGIISFDNIEISSFVNPRLTTIEQNQTDMGTELFHLVQAISENKNVVIINNEVGYGVVPIDKNERLFRELNGRFNIRIAQSSDEVYRVVSGICTRIK